jgi:hypothetical protein
MGLKRTKNRRNPRDRERLGQYEIRKQKLLRFLQSDEPAWKDEHHPELKAGSAEWVHNLRRGER